MSNLVTLVENCQFEKASQFLNKEDINLPIFEGGRSVLYKAIMVDAPLDFIMKIVELGADVNALPKLDFIDTMENDYVFTSPLKMALEMKRDDIAGFLLDNGAKIEDKTPYDSLFDYLMLLAAEENKLFEKFLEHGLTENFINKDGNTLLHYAVKNGNLYLTKKLLSIELINKRNTQGFTPLEELCNNKFLDFQSVPALSLILDNKPNVLDKKNVHVIFNALKNNSMSHLYFDKKHPTYKQKTEILECFLRHGMDVNITDNQDKNLIMWAVWNKQPDNIKILVKAGININHKDKLGKSALDYSRELFPEAITLIKNPDDDEALQACYQNILNETKIFKYYNDSKADKIVEMINNGYDINQHSSLFRGRLLDYLADRYFYEDSMAKALLKNNADPNLVPVSFFKEETQNTYQRLLSNFFPEYQENLLYLLFKKIKNKNMVDEYGNTIVMNIAKTGFYKEEKVQDILDNFIKRFDIDLNIRNENDENFFDIIAEKYPNLILHFQKLDVASPSPC